MIQKMMDSMEKQSFIWNFKQQIINIEDPKLNEMKQKIIMENDSLSFKSLIF